MRNTPGRQRLADAARALIDRIVGADATDDAFEEAARAVEGAITLLVDAPHTGDKPMSLPDFDDLQAVFWRDPIIGRSNPIAAPVLIEVDGTAVRGRGRFHHGYEGPPGYVHGAVIAACFDQMLGLANLAAGNAGMTGTLTIRYRRPTPLETDVVFEARSEGAEGRKIFTTGTLHAGEELCAEAEGIFVSLQQDKAAEYFIKPRQA